MNGIAVAQARASDAAMALRRVLAIEDADQRVGALAEITLLLADKHAAR